MSECHLETHATEPKQIASQRHKIVRQIVVTEAQLFSLSLEYAVFIVYHLNLRIVFGDTYIRSCRDTKVYILFHEGWDIVKNMYL